VLGGEVFGEGVDGRHRLHAVASDDFEVLEEVCRPHVRAESGPVHQVLAGADADQVGNHRRVAVSDVAERASVHRTGVFSRVCNRSGCSASSIRTVIAPQPSAARRSPARQPR
jgi:hypothetical protein